MSCVLEKTRAVCVAVTDASASHQVVADEQDTFNAFDAKSPAASATATTNASASPFSRCTPDDTSAHKTSVRRVAIPDVECQSQFPSLGGARRKLDAAVYGGEDTPAAKKRIQPTSVNANRETQSTTDLKSIRPQMQSRSAQPPSASTSTTKRTPRRVTAVPNAPASARTTVAAPPLRKDGPNHHQSTPGSGSTRKPPGFFESPGGNTGSADASDVSTNAFPASANDALAETEYEQSLFPDPGVDDVIGLSNEVTVPFSVELTPPQTRLATLHGACVRSGLIPDLVREIAWLSVLLATPMETTCLGVHSEDKTQNATSLGDEETSQHTSSGDTKKNFCQITSGPTARRYAAFVIRASGAVPLSVGERLLCGKGLSQSPRSAFAIAHTRPAKGLLRPEGTVIPIPHTMEYSIPFPIPHTNPGYTHGRKTDPFYVSALCSSASLKRFAPKTHAELAFELGVTRRRALYEQNGGASTTTLIDSGFGPDGGNPEVRSVQGGLSDILNATGHEPSRRGGGGGGGGTAFGANAANSEKAYRNREKARDLLYARLRVLASDGEGGGGGGGGGGVFRVVTSLLRLRTVPRAVTVRAVAGGGVTVRSHLDTANHHLIIFRHSSHINYCKQCQLKIRVGSRSCWCNGWSERRSRGRRKTRSRRSWRRAGYRNFTSESRGKGVSVVRVTLLPGPPRVARVPLPRKTAFLVMI